MTAAHLGALWRAETIKLFSRSSARFGLAMAAVVSLGALFALHQLATSDAMVNGEPLSTLLADARNAPAALRWGLLVRNFFLLRAFIILLGAQSVAGELQARTLREDLLRPVPRWSVLAAKAGALGTWIAASLGVAWVIGAALGSVALGTSGPWAEVAAGYLATWACDFGFAVVVITIALAVRSVAGTVMGVVLFLILDTVLGWALGVLAWAAGIDLVRQAVGTAAWALDLVARANPWMPSSAFAAWKGVSPEVDWAWQSFAALGLLLAVCGVVAERQLARLDLP